jgi:hypothetical protein
VDNLDFSALTDDQLVGLVRSALQEAVNRNPAVHAAAQAAVLDEAEAAKVRVEAAEKEARIQRAKQREAIAAAEAARVRAANAGAVAAAEAEKKRAEEEAKRVEMEAQRLAGLAEEEKVRKLWEYKTDLDRRLGQLIRGDRSMTVQVWLRGSDKRVYIQYDYDDKLVTYYHTGNARDKPGKLWLGGDAELAVKYGTATREQILALCVELCGKWNTFEHTTEPTAERAPASWPRYYKVGNSSDFFLTVGGELTFTKKWHHKFADRSAAEAAAEAYRSANPQEPVLEIFTYIGEPDA